MYYSNDNINIIYNIYYIYIYIYIIYIIRAVPLPWASLARYLSLCAGILCLRKRRPRLSPPLPLARIFRCHFVAPTALPFAALAVGATKTTGGGAANIANGAEGSACRSAARRWLSSLAGCNGFSVSKYGTRRLGFARKFLRLSPITPRLVTEKKYPFVTN